jgi:uncharacterized phage protein (TIGR02218 family)
VRTISAGLAAHLASGATTLCHCWKLALRSGETIGFTDHDRDLAFDGVTFERDAGFTATEIESALGLSVDNLEAAGALSSGSLSEARLAAGDFDDAAIELWRVNWSDVSQSLLLRKGNLGEVTRSKHAFTAELRGLAHVLNQPKGRIYQFGCDAVLGDGRCTVDLDAPAFRADASIVSSEDNRRFLVDGADGFAGDWFQRGTATFASGLNLSRSGDIKFHRFESGGARIELWHPMPFDIVPGDQLILRAGCDKQFATCRLKFSNAVNFRGFPHIPGDDFVLTYVSRTDADNDGESRNG